MTDEPRHPDDALRDHVVVPEHDAGPDQFPRLFNISAGFMYERMARALHPEPPEYVTVPELSTADDRLAVTVTQWNMLWEAAQYRRRFFDTDDLPAPMADVAELGDVNVVFVPRTRSRYHEYAPLLHLLPRMTLRRYGLPLLRAGQWPFQVDFGGTDRFLPDDFAERPEKAWASAVWTHLDSSAKPSAYAKDEPVRVLAHSLDFWIPAVTEVIQDRLREFPEVQKDTPLPPDVSLADGSVLEGVVPRLPRMGGDVWCGADDARHAISETVEAADRTGQLRSVIAAVRATRVEDDFSDQWSYPWEDFQRKIHHTRAKVSLVELTDTAPVQSPESQVIGNVVTNDFLALLKPRDREIVILLNSGLTSQPKIAERLGYANHGIISRRLDRIRRIAEAHFAQHG